MGTRDLTFDLYGRDRTASRTLQNVGNNASRMGSIFSKVGRVAALALAGLAVGAVKFGVDSVKAYAEAEESQNKLAFAFKKFPALADTNIGALRKLNEQLMKKTKFDDDASAAAQANLAVFNLTGAQIMKLTPLMQDYAEKTGKDLPTAANDLGKALLGQGRALKAVGIDFTDAGSVGANFDQVVAGLTKSVGGFAEAAGTTAAGRLVILQNRMGEVQEKIGAALMPALEALMDMFESNLAPAIEDFAGWLADDAIPAMSSFFDWLVKWQGVLVPAATAIGALTAAQWALNIAMAANPIGLVVAGLVAIVAIATAVTVFFEDIDKWVRKNPWIVLVGGVFSAAYAFNFLAQRGDELKRGLEIIGQTMQRVVQSIIGFFASLFQNISNFVGGIIRWFQNLGNQGGSMQGRLGGVVGAIIGFFGNLVGFIGGTIGRIIGLFGAMAGNASSLAGRVGGAISSLIGWFGSLIGGVQRAAGAVGGAVSGMIGHFGRIMGSVGSIPGQIAGAFQSIVGRMAGIGSSIVGGLIGGLRGAIGGAVSAAANAAASMLSAAKGALGINSPSRKFRDQVGKQIPAGIGEGVKRGAPRMQRIIDSLVTPPRPPEFPDLPGGFPPSVGGGGGTTVQIINKTGVSLKEFVDVRIKTASGWQALEIESGVGR